MIKLTYLFIITFIVLNFKTNAQATWVKSGAPIGDTSVFIYNDDPAFTNWPATTIGLGEPNGEDSISVSNITNNPSPKPDGIHLYRVDENPNNDSTLACHMPHYYGAFVADTADTNTTYTLDYFYQTCGAWALIDNQSFMNIHKRHDNSDTVMWNNIATATHNIPGQVFNKPNEQYRGEYYIDISNLQVNLGPDTANCNNITITLDPGNCYSSYNWDSGASTADTLDVNAAGTHYVHVTDNCANTVSDTIVISIGNVTDASINGGPYGPYCSADPLDTITSINPGGMWSGTGITNTNTGYFDPTTGVIGNNQIIYTTGGGGCSDSDTINITINQQQDASISSTPPISPYCSSDTPVNLASVNPGGTWSGTGITNPNTGIFDPGVAGPGNPHIISYIISGACPDTSTLQLNVIQQQDATITGGPYGPYCILNNSINLTSANPGGTWSGAGIRDPNTGDFIPANAGAGNTTIIYTLNGQCPHADTITIDVTPQADATINPVQPICFGDSTTLISALNPGGTWSGTGINLLGEFNNIISGVGSHPVSYGIPGQCGDTATINVIVNDIPSISILSDTIICDPITYAAPDGFSHYSWSTGEEGQLITFTEQGNYYLTITDINGCKNTDTTQVSIICPPITLYAPNSFSPNGDGINELFKIVGTNIIEFEMRIFNRWGNEVHHSNNLEIGWDGVLSNGNIAPNDIYIYKVDYKFTNKNNGTESAKTNGHLTLVR